LMRLACNAKKAPTPVGVGAGSAGSDRDGPALAGGDILDADAGDPLAAGGLGTGGGECPVRDAVGAARSDEAVGAPGGGGDVEDLAVDQAAGRGGFHALNIHRRLSGVKGLTRKDFRPLGIDTGLPTAHTEDMSNTTAAKTPGFNCRQAVRFTTDKNGRRLAQRWMRTVSGGRWVKVSTTDAEMWLAQDLADLA
jgi:hypothetical protein